MVASRPLSASAVREGSLRITLSLSGLRLVTNRSVVAMVVLSLRQLLSVDFSPVIIGRGLWEGNILCSVGRHRRAHVMHYLALLVFCSHRHGLN